MKNTNPLVQKLEKLHSDLIDEIKGLIPESLKVDAYVESYNKSLTVKLSNPKVFWNDYMTIHVKENDLKVNHGCGGYNDDVSALEILDAEIEINQAVKTIYENRSKMLKIAEEIVKAREELERVIEKNEKELKELNKRKNLQEAYEAGLDALTPKEAIKNVSEGKKIYYITSSENKPYKEIPVYKAATGRLYYEDKFISKKDLKALLEKTLS